MKKGEKPEYDNIAPEAKADGICDYTNDLGGLATLNDGYEPTESHDTSHGAWHNWNNRYENGVAKNAWVSYTWDKPVELIVWISIISQITVESWHQRVQALSI